MIKAHNQRQKIVSVASRLMSQKGYKGASMQDIADHVGIHKSTLFHYFKNKEEILLEVLGEGVKEVTDGLDSILADRNVPPVEKLKRAMDNHLLLLVKYIDNVTVYNNDIRYLSPKNKRKYLDTRKHYQLCFEQIIDDIKKTNGTCFQGMDTKIVTFGILGMCNWVAKWYKKAGPFKSEDISEILFKMITQGNHH